MGAYTGQFLAEVNNWCDAMREDVAQALRPAAQEGAQVLYDEVRTKVPVSAEAHWFHGKSFKKNGKKYLFQPGTLRSAIYQVHSKDNSGQMFHTYHISWNHRKAPYGFMVEYGTANAPPKFFLRNAGAQMPKALDVVEKGFYKRLKEFK